MRVFRLGFISPMVLGALLGAGAVLVVQAVSRNARSEPKDVRAVLVGNRLTAFAVRHGVLWLRSKGKEDEAKRREMGAYLIDIAWIACLWHAGKYGVVPQGMGLESDIYVPKGFVEDAEALRSEIIDVLGVAVERSAIRLAMTEMVEKYPVLAFSEGLDRNRRIDFVVKYLVGQGP